MPETVSPQAESWVGKYVRFRHLPESVKASPLRVVAESRDGIYLEGRPGGAFDANLFVVVEDPTDDRYFYAAMHEIMGLEFVLDANVPLSVLSQIARRAAEIKHEELAKAERSPV